MTVTTDRVPVGEIRIKDPNPINWLFITWNTVEEPIRTDENGNIVPAVLTDFRWSEDGLTLEVDVREDVRFQDGTPLSAHDLKKSFDELQRWKAPHPPGTFLNFDPATTCEVVHDHQVRFHFPAPDGLALAKFRGLHVMNPVF